MEISLFFIRNIIFLWNFKIKFVGKIIDDQAVTKNGNLDGNKNLNRRENINPSN